jgi:hypothetical protein
MHVSRDIVKRRLLCTFVVMSLSLLSLVFTVNAYAADANTGAKPHVVSCDAGWAYTDLTRYANTIATVGPTQSDYNGTGSAASATFSATTSGTISLSASSSAKVSAGVIITNVELTFGISVTTSLTATVGNSITISIPSHKTGYAAYGVWEVVTYGHYYYINSICQTTINDGYIDTYSPSYVGWRVWTA